MPQVAFPSRPPSAAISINAAVVACLERFVRRMSGRVREGGGEVTARALAQVDAAAAAAAAAAA